MDQLRFAILAAAPDAPEAAIQGLIDARAKLLQITTETKFRVAHLIGQCAHESLRFTHDTENLFYTTPSRLQAVWPSRFRSARAAEPFTRNPEKLANKVYGGRKDLGNTEPGDGFKFRGRGYIQLTGRANYTRFGEIIGIDLVSHPELAVEPEVAWQLATAYMQTRKRARKSVFDWADLNDVETVTRAINGGVHGLADRKTRTFRALEALEGTETHPALQRGANGVGVMLLQQALARAGFSPGGLDGAFGGGTEAALVAFQKAEGLPATGASDKETWFALDATTNSADRITATSQKRPPATGPKIGEKPASAAPATAPRPVPRPARAVEEPIEEPQPAPAKDAMPQLRRGDHGEAVMVLQLALMRQGFEVSSRFGPSTEQAVRAFQAAKGLGIDGIVGTNTWKALGPLPK
ncbi:peptidoglycan-binding protein [Rhodobacteraceae bacterium NNCM2]|nr:peptidoglycan-binding protein [Coraliihabitans acroporae]